MTAVANPPSFQQNSRSPWGASVGQGGLNAMNPDEVTRMFMPRKSASRGNSSSSIASTSSNSSTSTITQSPVQTNGVPMSTSGGDWGTAAARKKPHRAGPWPSSKAEAISGVSTARPQSILTTNGPSATSSMTSIHQPSSILPSQHILQNPPQQANGTRPVAAPVGEGNPVLYLLSMNGTFERKTISVPFYPDSLRIGRQTNAKTVPTPANGFFDSKVLSRQHAEIWADRSGKIYIRDVKSSNGTFVNGARLSPENRDSEPHELSSSDHLELGIDIVSEDQKTVVHHKVAAKVEHAGFLGATNNVLDMNFGDLDPANSAMMVPSQQMRGRTTSQGSVGSNGSRMGPPSSVAASQISGMGQQRPQNFWLSPVTTEQIVKRLTHEMRIARSQANDLGRADVFLGSLVMKHDVQENEKQPPLTDIKLPLVNGGSLPFRDAKPRFSDPPAPPPQQPLPEKPDAARPHAFEPSSPSSKSINNERSRSVPNASPIRQEPSSQIISLIEALATSKKEIDAQGARMRDLEEMLMKERQARETAEDLAKRLELQLEGKLENGYAQEDAALVSKETLETPSEPNPSMEDESKNTLPNGKAVDPKAISESTLLLEQKLETMMADMFSLKAQMESFKHRAETAESERDADRKSLAEMVLKIRSDECKRSSSTEAVDSDTRKSLATDDIQTSAAGEIHPAIFPFLEKAGLSNGHAITTDHSSDPNRTAVSTFSRTGNHEPIFYHAVPYASALGVVLIGMSVMAYMNGWQYQPPRVDR